MKTIAAILLILLSTSVLAGGRRDCSNVQGECAKNPPGQLRQPSLEKHSTIPVPGTLALVGLGIAGLVIVQNWRR
jgi:hypothetical protein